MTNSTGNFNVKETPRGQKQRPADCVVTPTHNLQQFSEFEEWLEKTDFTELGDELEEMLTLGWVFGYDILPANPNKFLEIDG